GVDVVRLRLLARGAPVADGDALVVLARRAVGAGAAAHAAAVVAALLAGAAAGAAGAAPGDDLVGPLADVGVRAGPDAEDDAVRSHAHHLLVAVDGDERGAARVAVAAGGAEVPDLDDGVGDAADVDGDLALGAGARLVEAVVQAVADQARAL